MNIITMPHSKDHAKQVPQTAIMIKPNLKVQLGKKGGPRLFLIGSRKDINFLSRILWRGQQFEVHFMSNPLPKVVLCKVIILRLCVKLILIIARYITWPESGGGGESNL